MSMQMQWNVKTIFQGHGWIVTYASYCKVGVCWVEYNASKKIWSSFSKSRATLHGLFSQSCYLVSKTTSVYL